MQLCWKRKKTQQQPKKNLNEVTVDNGQTVHIPGECSASTNAVRRIDCMYVSFYQNKEKKGVVRKPNVQNLQVLVLDEKKVSIDEIK